MTIVAYEIEPIEKVNKNGGTMIKIKMPKWGPLITLDASETETEVDWTGVIKWFIENIKGKWVVDPKDCIEVEIYRNSKDNGWYIADHKGTHKAYLGGITPIKQESAEDVLRSIIEWRKGERIDWESIYNRAKAALEREKVKKNE